VPVPIAPPMVWQSMSPWLPSESPSFHKAPVTRSMVQPAGTVAVRRSAETVTAPGMASSDTSAPSVSQSGMKECPAPATRRVRARRMTSASAASLVGRAISAGCALTLPDQLVQVSVAAGASASLSMPAFGGAEPAPSSGAAPDHSRSVAARGYESLP
jgi:hypothetical protein